MQWKVEQTSHKALVFLLQRRDFDCTVNAEPYHVLHLVADLRSGLFLIRVLGKTFARGSVKSDGDAGLVSSVHEC